MNNTVKISRGIANGVQTKFADALNAMPDRMMEGGNARVPASIGYQCPVYAPGMGPAPMSAGDTTIDVGSGKTFHD